MEDTSSCYRWHSFVVEGNANLPKFLEIGNEQDEKINPKLSNRKLRGQSLTLWLPSSMSNGVLIETGNCEVY